MSSTPRVVCTDEVLQKKASRYPTLLSSPLVPFLGWGVGCHGLRVLT